MKGKSGRLHFMQKPVTRNSIFIQIIRVQRHLNTESVSKNFIFFCFHEEIQLSGPQDLLLKAIIFSYYCVDQKTVVGRTDFEPDLIIMRR